VNTSRITIDVTDTDQFRRVAGDLAQANEIIDELRQQVEDLTDENNELRRCLGTTSTATADTCTSTEVER
jgi:hypothetical protein